MNKIVQVLLVLVCAFLLSGRAFPSAAEMEGIQAWAAPLFDPLPENRETGRLEIVEQYDLVWRNCRVDRPLVIRGNTFHRGLFTHAPSTVRVKLPEPVKAFSALVGIDTNDQTRGGRGSVIFKVLAVTGEVLYQSDVLREGMDAVPVNLVLKDIQEFMLVVEDGGDGNACDQADWVDAKVRMGDDSDLWLGDMSITGQKAECSTIKMPGQELPFSFKYGEADSKSILAGFHKEVQPVQEAEGIRRHSSTYSDPTTGLQVRCDAVEYREYPVVEWTLHFKNTGSVDTPVISEIFPLDASFARLSDDAYGRFASKGEFVLHHHTGSICAAEDYEPHASPLERGKTLQLASAGGRGSNGTFPYFNLEWPGEGMMIAIGWPGQWSAAFARNEDTGIRVTAGQEQTHFVLHPGEEVRSPLVAVQYWIGDRVDAQNTWRRWMISHNVPRQNGALRPTHLTGCSSHFFGEMVTADEASQIEFIDRYVEERIPIDYWWMDAGWYVNATGWPNTGTWEVDQKRFPRGLRYITDHARSKGINSIVWFEPERVTPGTWLYDTHPEWLLGEEGGQKLLDLGNPEAWAWLVNHVDKVITEQGIDLYRQDFNMDPLDYWRRADAPDRQGITEIRHITGYLAFWDELLRRHPGIRIDSCASGGRRNDLESMRRSVPLWRTDYILEPVGAQGCTYGISSWIPFHGTGVKEPDEYLFHSLMTPYPNCLWDARRQDLNYEELRRLVRQWQSVSPCYAGDFYPLTTYSLDRDAWIGWQFDLPETGEGMVQVFRRENSIYRSADLVLRGLDRTATYTITNLDAPEGGYEVAGGELLGKGLSIEIPDRPGSILLRYVRKQ